MFGGKHLKAGYWLITWLVVELIMSYIGSKDFGAPHQIFPYPWDIVVIIVCSLVFYYWAVRCGWLTPDAERINAGNFIEQSPRPLKREPTFWDLAMVSLGGFIGSGRLYGAWRGAQLAGRASIISFGTVAPIEAESAVQFANYWIPGLFARGSLTGLGLGVAALLMLVLSSCPLSFRMHTRILSRCMVRTVDPDGLGAERIP